MRLLRSLALMGTAAGVWAGVTSAQAPAPAHTPWGEPDLQGTFTSEAELSVPFERPPQYGERRLLTDAEFAQRRAQIDTQVVSDNSDFELESADRSNAGAVGSATSPPPHWLERGRVSRRTSLVIDPPDGRLPPAVPRPGRAGADALTGTFAGLGAFGATAVISGPEDLSLWERCITRGVPAAIFPTVYNANVRIVQGPGVVAITYEMIHDTRVIPVTATPHAGQAVRGYHGDSRGHWEGDTLVVDTTNFNAKSSFRGAKAGLHLIERFTRDGDDIAYTVTVSDDTVWTRPWTAALTLARQRGDAVFEYGCHEGNNSMRNILTASRAAEAGRPVTKP